MLITLCLIILGYIIVGKDVKPLVEKLKSVIYANRDGYRILLKKGCTMSKVRLRYL